MCYIVLQCATFGSRIRDCVIGTFTVKIRFRLREISAILGLDQFRCKRSISDTTVLIVLIVLIAVLIVLITNGANRANYGANRANFKLRRQRARWTEREGEVEDARLSAQC